MAFTVEGVWLSQGRRPVSITWDGGDVRGDAELAGQLRTLEGSGEPIRVERADGKPVVTEASLATPEIALETICYWIGHVTAIRGDVGSADPSDFID